MVPRFKRPIGFISIGRFSFYERMIYMTDRKVILTGDRPTGKLHIGHYVGSLRNRVQLQNSGNYDTYIMIADMQALTDNARDPEKKLDIV